MAVTAIVAAGGQGVRMKGDLITARGVTYEVVFDGRQLLLPPRASLAHPLSTHGWSYSDGGRGAPSPEAGQVRHRRAVAIAAAKAWQPED